MSSRVGAAIVGGVIGACMNILYNLIAAGIQKQALNDQFSPMTLVILGVMTLLGILLGAWIDTIWHRRAAAKPTPPANATTNPSPPSQVPTGIVTMNGVKSWSLVSDCAGRTFY